MVLGNQIGKELCEALKLPKQTKSFVLRVDAGKAVSVECEYYPENSDFIAVLAEFALVRKEPAVHVEPAPALHFDTWMRLRTHKAHAEYEHRMRMLVADDAIEAEKRRIAAMREVAVIFKGIV